MIKTESPSPGQHPETKAETTNKDIERFLKGPQNRRYELFFTLRVAWEFIKGFRALHFVGPCITVFGSARFEADNKYYQQAREIGRLIAEMGFTTITGGGPGIMEAANRGAFEAGGRSVGCNIKLPHEQAPNPYMHKWVELKYFFARKVLLLKYSFAFVVMPGGMGTMDELFETATLIQTGKIKDFPIVLLGKGYYSDLLKQLDDMIAQGTISASDRDLIFVTDSTEDAIAHIRKFVIERLATQRKPRPTPWLLEKISVFERKRTFGEKK